MSGPRRNFVSDKTGYRMAQFYFSVVKQVHHGEGFWA
jgi:hypothetical protein